MAVSQAARARAKQRDKRRERRRRHHLAQALGHAGPTGSRLAGVSKMSDVLVAFAQPVLDTLDDDASIDEIRSALHFASAIWNILAMFDEEHRRSGGVLPDEQRLAEITGLLRDTVSTFGDVPFALGLVDAMRDRRRTLFPDDRRIIMKLEAELRGGHVHVQAASALI